MIFRQYAARRHRHDKAIQGPDLLAGQAGSRVKSVRIYLPKMTRKPNSAFFDRPDEGLDYRIGKAQKKAFDEIKGLRAKGLERRAGNPPLKTSGA